MDPIAMIITVIPDVLGMKARKIARPKNCFVIYRLDKHADIKALNPDLTNNDCCKYDRASYMQTSLTTPTAKVIAQMWRNEPQSVKDEYRSRAEAERRQHAIDHPGYQYQPRKPSEKKKRMTKNKVAKLATSSNTVARNTQVPRQQLPLSRSTFASRVAPPMDLLAAMHTSGNDVDQLGAFPRFKVPKATTPKNLRTAPRTVEQTRQNVLDAENDMNQFFDFTKAIEDLPSNFLPTDAWEAERTTANQ